MKFFIKLFRGEFCPVENNAPKTPEYREVAYALAKALEKLEKAMSAEQRIIFETSQNI